GALGVALGGGQAGGLVIAEQARRRRGGDRLAVDRHSAQRSEQRRGRIEHLAVQGDSPVRDHALDVATRRDSGTGQQLGDALRFFGIG
ncbi:hypothetical protein QU38_00770, partial [Staphylococcus aureus]